MATYDVDFFAMEGNQWGDPDTIAWNGAGGSTTALAPELSAGDIVRFKKGGTASSPTVSGFSGNFWTSSSTINLTTSYQSKTVKTGGTPGTVATLTATNGNASVTGYFKYAGAPPDTSIDDIDDQIITQGSTSFSITIANGSSHTIYEVRMPTTGGGSAYTGTVVGTLTGNGTLTVTSNVPNSGYSQTYFLSGRRSVANGGSNAPSGVQSFTIVHETAGSTVGDGGTGTYGLRVYDASGEIVLDLSDRVIVFSDHVTGSLTSSQTTKNVTLAKQATCVIDLEPETVLISGGLAQRQNILHTSVSGTTLSISRTSVYPGGDSNQTAQSTTYNFLAIYDPE
jgi:hypothetical protein